jgi:hypothetical protein
MVLLLSIHLACELSRSEQAHGQRPPQRGATHIAVVFHRCEVQMRFKQLQVHAERSNRPPSHSADRMR